jgi:hypothetical protein
VVYIIIKEGRSERRERVYGRVSRSASLREKASGHARNAEEASEIAHRELRDREDARPLIVEGGREREQAFDDLHRKAGFDPDQLRHQWGLKREK